MARTKPRRTTHLGKALVHRFLQKVAAGFEDEVSRVTFLAELAGDAEDLPLALVPFAAGVDEEEAQNVSRRRAGMTAGIFTRSS
jgi:hypothetical protein